MTVVSHELGHLFGLMDGDGAALMVPTLAAGMRILPDSSDLTAPHQKLTPPPPALGEVNVSLTAQNNPSRRIDETALAGALDRVPLAESIDWLSVAATLKPKNGLFADWLATTDEA